MNFKPLGDRVLLKVQAVETKTASGIIIPDNASKEKPTQAQVVAIGNDVEHVAVGDQVIFSQYARSAAVTIDAIDYIIMEVSEILGTFGGDK